jgi:hypothetical protein
MSSAVATSTPRSAGSEARAVWTVSDTAAAAVAEAVYGPPDVPFEPALSPYRLHTVLSCVTPNG